MRCNLILQYYLEDVKGDLMMLVTYLIWRKECGEEEMKGQVVRRMEWDVDDDELGLEELEVFSLEALASLRKRFPIQILLSFLAFLFYFILFSFYLSQLSSSHSLSC